MIENLKELEKLLKLCRKQGVLEIKLGSVELKLGELPSEETLGSQAKDESLSKDPYAHFPEGELTPEQLMFYSAGGVPESDPYLTKEHIT